MNGEDISVGLKFWYNSTHSDNQIPGQVSKLCLIAKYTVPQILNHKTFPW